MDTLNVDEAILKYADVALRLELTPHGHRCRVFVGDKELRGIFGLKVEASVHAATVVHLDMYALGGVTVDGIAEILTAGVTTEEQLRARTQRGSLVEVTTCGDLNKQYRQGTGDDEVDG